MPTYRETYWRRGLIGARALVQTRVHCCRTMVSKLESPLGKSIHGWRRVKSPVRRPYAEAPVPIRRPSFGGRHTWPLINSILLTLLDRLQVRSCSGNSSAKTNSIAYVCFNLLDSIFGKDLVWRKV